MGYGIRLHLLLGSPAPRPADHAIAEAVERVEVVCDDDAPGAFQIVFKAGRGGPGGRVDQSLLRAAALAAGSRVVIVVFLGPRPSVLLDGIITHRQYTPGATAGAGVVAVTGDDLTVLMDEEQRIAAYPAMNDAAIATAILGRYARHGVTPQVIPPAVADQPVPAVRTPIQHGTDLDHLYATAARANHVFVLRPGPAPLSSVGYWGPAAGLAGPPLPAVSVVPGDVGYAAGARFTHDAFAPVRVSGQVVDADSGRVVSLLATPPPLSPLSSRPAVPRRAVLPAGNGGLGAAVAQVRAQAVADASTRSAVVAEGEVDTGRYGAVLRPHRLVGMRGAGRSFDGLYQVRQVTHVLERGAYRQRFRLARPGTDTTTPVVTGGLG